MNLDTIVRKVHPKLTPYKASLPDLPLADLKKVLGKDTVYKLSFNENPLGPSPKAVQAMIDSLQTLNLYPSSAGEAIQEKIAAIEGISPEQIILSNGADEMIVLLALTFFEPEDEIIIPKISFIQYLASTNLMGATPIFTAMKQDLSADLNDILDKLTPKTKAIFLCNPNNPTGTSIPHAEIESFLQKVPANVVIIIDEAYMDYAVSDRFATAVRYIEQRKLLFVVRTFSKLHSLAGARLGYGIGSPEVVKAVDSVRPPFNVNAIVQAGALASIEDTEHIQQSLHLASQGKEMLYEAFRSLGLPYMESDTNFVYVDTLRDTQEIFDRLAADGIIVRTLNGYGLNTALRISVGKLEEMEAFIQAFKRIMTQDAIL